MEHLAAVHLRAAGMRIIARNYRCRLGEIDLVGERAGCLHFVEVRYRRSTRFGGAAASVTLAKQARIARTASHFLSRHPRYGRARCTFDVVTVVHANSRPEIEWLTGAFAAPG